MRLLLNGRSDPKPSGQRARRGERRMGSGADAMHPIASVPAEGRRPVRYCVLDSRYWNVAMVAVRQTAMESALASASSATPGGRTASAAHQPPAADPVSALPAAGTENNHQCLRRKTRPMAYSTEQAPRLRHGNHYIMPSPCSFIYRRLRANEKARASHDCPSHYAPFKKNASRLATRGAGGDGPSVAR